MVANVRSNKVVRLIKSFADYIAAHCPSKSFISMKVVPESILTSFALLIASFATQDGSGFCVDGCRCSTRSDEVLKEQTGSGQLVWLRSVFAVLLWFYYSIDCTRKQDENDKTLMIFRNNVEIIEAASKNIDLNSIHD